MVYLSLLVILYCIEVGKPIRIEKIIIQEYNNDND